jgi:hypothetical protein
MTATIAVLIFSAGFVSGWIFESRRTMKDYKYFAASFKEMSEAYREALDAIINIKKQDHHEQSE